MGDHAAITQVTCPVCTPCPACRDERVLTVRERAHYRAARTLRKDVCPRCATHGPSDVCAICEGTRSVPPGVTALWQVLNKP